MVDRTIRRRDYATIQQAAEYVGCNQKTIRRQISAGKIPAYRLGRLLRVDLAEVDAALRPLHTVKAAS